jgi:hypothetical protein
MPNARILTTATRVTQVCTPIDLNEARHVQPGVAPAPVEPRASDWCLSASELCAHLDIATDAESCAAVARRLHGAPTNHAREASDSFRRARAALAG